MKVLVIAASKHGSTMGIAETVGETLREEGLERLWRPLASSLDRSEATEFEKHGR